MTRSRSRAVSGLLTVATAVAPATASAQSTGGAQAGSVDVRVVRADDGSPVHAWTVPASAGSNTVAWDGTTSTGPAPSGSYRFELGTDARATQQGAAASSTGFTFLDHMFPIRGKHDLGQSPTNGYGGGRGHQGQDMFAACGTPVAVTRGGRVRFAGFQSAAGNYAVITSKRTGLDYVYMHMRAPALVKQGDDVTTGQPLGEVGDTGRASGCHLHFELWSKPGWYSGGTAFDPLPRLRAWDAWS